MKTFDQLTYQGQVRRLRLLAILTLDCYSVGKIEKIKFINYGENATFKIITKNSNYLLRLCRPDYHSPSALNEEINWLRTLNTFNVPKPVLLKNKKYLGNISSLDGSINRNFILFKWQNGRFFENELSLKQMHKIGELVGQLHQLTKNKKVQHRKYWDAKGLAGEPTKFGSLLNLTQASLQQQKFINKARLQLFSKLTAFQKKYPRKMGLIHADIHFGNLFQSKGKITLIDFDDCGYGFYVYDLAVILISYQQNFNKNKFLKYKNELLEGYKKYREWGSADEEILVDLMRARRLLMLAWRNQRSEIPRNQKIMKLALKQFCEIYVSKIY